MLPGGSGFLPVKLSDPKEAKQKEKQQKNAQHSQKIKTDHSAFFFARKYSSARSYPRLPRPKIPPTQTAERYEW